MSRGTTDLDLAIAGVGSGGYVTAVLAAMPEEGAALRARLRASCRVRRARPEVTIGQIGGVSIALAITGVGARNARIGAALFLSALRGRMQRLLVIGAAGALSPALRVGDLVAAERVGHERGSPLYRADHDQLERAVRCIGVRPAVLVSAERIADEPAYKRHLRELARADGREIVVDLESASYVALAEAEQVPWLVLRAISDTAEERLPALLNRCRDAGGAVRRSAVLRALLMDPRPLPRLLELRARMKRCGERLADGVQAWLSEDAAAFGSCTAGAGTDPRART